MKTKMLTALLGCAALALPTNAANAPTAFRSIEVGNIDGTSMVINMDADMRLKFSADSMFVVSDQIAVSFAMADIKGWGFSTEYVQPEPEPEPEPELPTVYPSAGDGTWETPFNSMALREYEATDSVWVTGYIVGSFSDNDIVNTNFTAEGHNSGNILLAPAPDANHHSQCIGVQLPAYPSSTVRDAVNLVDNPDVLGREVSIRGIAGQFGGVQGVRMARHFAWGPQGFDTSAPVDAIEEIAANGKPTWSAIGASLTVSGLPQGSKVVLYNAAGRTVSSTTASGDATIATGSLAPGIYILNINGTSVKISVNK